MLDLNTNLLWFWRVSFVGMETSASKMGETKHVGQGKKEHSQTRV